MGPRKNLFISLNVSSIYPLLMIMRFFKWHCLMTGDLEVLRFDL